VQHSTGTHAIVSPNCATNGCVVLLVTLNGDYPTLDRSTTEILIEQRR
jgi:hypothetical protein